MNETKIDDGIKDLLDDNLNANNFTVALKTLSVLFVQFSNADVVLRESVTEEIERLMIKMSLVHVCLFLWKQNITLQSLNRVQWISTFF